MLIGELAEASGATTKTLRFYEEAGLLPAPERTAAGYRDHNAQILPRLDFIRRGRAAGLSLTQIREVLEVRDAGSPPCQHVQDLLGRRLPTSSGRFPNSKLYATPSPTCETQPARWTPAAAIDSGASA